MKKRRTKSKARDRHNPLDEDFYYNKNQMKAKKTENMFHPQKSGITDTQYSDIESAQYLGKHKRPQEEEESDRPPQFIDNETLQKNVYQSAVEIMSPHLQNDKNFRIGDMDSDIEESGGVPGEQNGLNQSFSTENSAKDVNNRKRGKSGGKMSGTNRSSPNTKFFHPHARKNSKPSFLNDQHQAVGSGFSINQRIRNQKRESQNKILQKAYAGKSQAMIFNQYTNKNRKIVPKSVQLIKQHSGRKQDDMMYNLQEDDSMFKQRTLNDQLSDNTFNRQTGKRERLQSAQTRKKSNQIEEIQEEGPFDSINIKTPGQACMTDVEQEESAQLLNYYRNKFSKRGLPVARSAKALSNTKRMAVSSSSAMSRGNLQIQYGREDLQDQLQESKKKLNQAMEDKKTISTQNKALKREIQANEKVIQLILQNQGPSSRTQSLNHYSLLMQCKRKLREVLQENNSLKISNTQMRKDMSKSNEALLLKENQELLIQSQTMQFNIKRLQDYISDLKEKLNVQIKTDLAKSDSRDQYELKQQIKDYKVITRKQEHAITQLEKSSLKLEEELTNYQFKIEDMKQKFETKESKLYLKLSQANSEMSSVSHYKRLIEQQKHELKQNRTLIDSFKPKLEIFTKDKQKLVQERDYMSTQLQAGMKEYRSTIKDKSKELMKLQEECETKIKSMTQKHAKELQIMNNKLNKAYGQNKTLDDQLMVKQTDISTENKLKVKIKQLEQEIDRLKIQSKNTKSSSPKKTSLHSITYSDKDEYKSHQLKNEQQILEKDYAIEKLQTRVGVLENKNKELLNKLKQRNAPSKITERDDENEPSKSEKDVQNQNEATKLNEQIESQQNDLDERNEQLLALQKKYESMELNRQEMEEEIRNNLRKIHDQETQLEEANAQLMDRINNQKQTQNDKEIEINSLSQTIDDQNIQIELLQKSLEPAKELQGEIEALEADLTELRDGVQEKIQQMDEKDKQILTYKEEILQMQNRIEEKDVMIENQNNQQMDQNQLQIELRSQIQSLDEQNNELQNLIEQKQLEAKQLSNAGGQDEKEAIYQTQLKQKEAIYQTQLKEKDQQLEQLRGESNEKLDAANLEINQLKAILIQLQEEYGGQHENNQAEIDTLRVTISELNENVAIAEQRDDQQQIEIHELQNTISNLQDVIANHERNISPIQFEGSVMNEPTAEIEQSIGDIAKDNEIEVLKQRHQQEIKEIVINLENSITERNELYDIKLKLEMQIQQLKVQNQNQNQDRDIDRETEDNSGLKNQLAQLEAENMDLKEKMEQMNFATANEERINTQVSKQQSTTNLSEGSAEKASDLQAEIEAKKREIIEAAEVKQSLISQLEDIKAELKDLKIINHDKTSDVERLRQEMKSQEDDFRYIRQELSDLKIEVKSKELEVKRLNQDLDKASESKNQLFEKLLAEKDAKTLLIQELAQERENSAQLGRGQNGSPSGQQQNQKKQAKQIGVETSKQKEIEMNMEQVDENSKEDISMEVSDAEPEQQDSMAEKSKQPGSDSEEDQYQEYIESEKSIVTLDDVDDRNPSDTGVGYEHLFQQQNIQMNPDGSMVTIDEFNNTKSVTSNQEYMVEDNPPDSMFQYSPINK